MGCRSAKMDYFLVLFCNGAEQERHNVRKMPNKMRYLSETNISQSKYRPYNQLKGVRIYNYSILQRKCLKSPIFGLIRGAINQCRKRKRDKRLTGGSPPFAGIRTTGCPFSNFFSEIFFLFLGNNLLCCSVPFFG